MHKVLIVEDDSAVRLNLETFLEDEGFKVKAATTGEDAIELIKNFTPDISIIDIRLPGIDGNEVMLKVNDSHPQSKFIIYTGYLGYTLPEQISALGVNADQVLFKPVQEMKQFSRMIEQLL